MVTKSLWTSRPGWIIRGDALSDDMESVRYEALSQVALVTFRDRMELTRAERGGEPSRNFQASQGSRASTRRAVEPLLVL